MQPYNSIDTEITVLFIREIRLPYSYITNSSLCLLHAYVDIGFSRWDIAAEVSEMI